VVGREASRLGRSGREPEWVVTAARTKDSKGNFPALRGEEAEWKNRCPGRKLIIEQAIQL
jgi:hypothetical protein